MIEYFYDEERDEYGTMEYLQDFYYCNQDVERPEYFDECTKEVWPGLELHLLSEYIYDLLTDFCDGDDDDKIAQIVDMKELEDFVSTWNKKQVISRLNYDRNKKVRIDWSE